MVHLTRNSQSRPSCLGMVLSLTRGVCPITSSILL